MANTKGILFGQTEASCCVDVLSRLESFPISQRVLQANRIEEWLEHLTKHKNQKIRFTASALLLQWRQSIRNQEHQDFANAKKPSNLTTRGIRLKQPHRISSSLTTSNCVDKNKANPLDFSGNMGSYILKDGDRSQTVGEAIPKNKTDLLELLLTAKKEANAAADGSSSPMASRCVEALNQIERILRSFVHVAIFRTQIGNKVHSLIHHSNPKIRFAAESLYYGWLRILYTSNGNTSTSSGNSNPQEKIESKSMNKKIGDVKGKNSRNNGINSVLKKWKLSRRH